MHVFLLEFALYLHGKAIFTLVKDVGGRLAERVESVDQNETEHMSERQKKNLICIHKKLNYIPTLTTLLPLLFMAFLFS
jgi:hypothetical protein